MSAKYFTVRRRPSLAASLVVPWGTCAQKTVDVGSNEVGVFAYHRLFASDAITGGLVNKKHELEILHVDSGSHKAGVC